MKQKQQSAVSLGLATTKETLEVLKSIAEKGLAAEIRLDLMSEFDLHRLIVESPCQLILTNRPLREGGKFLGDEKARLEPLIRGLRLGVSHIDVEWDIAHLILPLKRHFQTKIIVSRHFLEGLPEDLIKVRNEMISLGPDIIKIAALPSGAIDTVRIINLFTTTSFPTIAIAMGNIGIPSRLLCYTMPSCYLSYISINGANITAVGQLSLENAYNLFQIDLINEFTIPIFFLGYEDQKADYLFTLNKQLRIQRLNALCIPVFLGEESFEYVLRAYCNLKNPFMSYFITSKYQHLAYSLIDEADAAAHLAGRVDTILQINGLRLGYWTGSSSEQEAPRYITLWKQIIERI